MTQKGDAVIGGLGLWVTNVSQALPLPSTHPAL